MSLAAEIARSIKGRFILGVVAAWLLFQAVADAGGARKDFA